MHTPPGQLKDNPGRLQRRLRASRDNFGQLQQVGYESPCTRQLSTVVGRDGASVNENLKNAIHNSGLSVEQLAQAIQVDPKSVKRWVNATTTPYPKHRDAIARALNVSEWELWPERYPAPSTPHTPGTPPPGPTATPTPAAQTPTAAAPLGELAGCWGDASQITAPDPATIIAAIKGPIDVLDPGPAPWPETTLAAALTAQADTGRAIRILTPPLNASEQRAGNPRIQHRVTEHTLTHGLLRVGNTLLLILPLPGEPRQPPAVIQLNNTIPGGLFDRLTHNYDTLWKHASPPSSTSNIETPAADAGLAPPQPDSPDTHARRPAPTATPARPAARAASTNAPNQHPDPPRRWPRRAQ